MNSQGSDSHEKDRKSDGRKKARNLDSHEKAQKGTKKWTRSSMNELCDVVRESAFSAHRFLRSGHMEKIYENSLAHRLRKAGLKVEQQHHLDVFDEDGTPLGHLVADLFIEGCLLVEIKACRTIAPEHIAQLLGYLRASGIETGLLINFGSPKLQIKKYVMTDDAV